MPKTKESVYLVWSGNDGLIAVYARKDDAEQRRHDEIEKLIQGREWLRAWPDAKERRFRAQGYFHIEPREVW
jgi:hypothetical protein